MKTDLFRFVTLRTPQLISEEKKKVGFIFHPLPVNSFFLKKIKNVTDLDIAREKLLEATTQFTPLKTLESVKKIDTNVYKFSSWLMSYRNILSREIMQEFTNRPASLSKEQLMFVWDNLFYQTLTKSSSYVKAGLYTDDYCL